MAFALDQDSGIGAPEVKPMDLPALSNPNLDRKLTLERDPLYREELPD
jgi:hypothetical protein